MTLIDTLSWIETLRQDGDPEVRGRVQSLLQTGDASWCNLVRVELWHGVRGAAERRMMDQLDADVHLLPTTDAVWATARELARFDCRFRRTHAKARRIPKSVVSSCLRAFV